MEICWDNIEGVILTTKGTFRKGHDVYVIDTCELCGEDFLRVKSRQTKRCSKRCAFKNRKFSNEHRQKISEAKKGKKLSKDTCKKISMGHIGIKHSYATKQKIGDSNRNKVVSQESRKRMSKAHKGKRMGKNNYNWNPNLTEHDRMYRRDLQAYKDWRVRVLKRDNFTCRCCTKQNVKFNVHHIVNYSDNPLLRLSTENGITLCEKCHIKFHKQFGYKKNNKEQLDIFMNKKGIKNYEY